MNSKPSRAGAWQQAPPLPAPRPCPRNDSRSLPQLSHHRNHASEHSHEHEHIKQPQPPSQPHQHQSAPHPHTSTSTTQTGAGACTHDARTHALRLTARSTANSKTTAIHSPHHSHIDSAVVCAGFDSAPRSVHCAARLLRSVARLRCSARLLRSAATLGCYVRL